MRFKSGLKVERESQFNTAGGREFHVRVAAVLNDRLANDVRRNGTHSSGTDDDRVLRALVRSEMCWLRYCGDEVCCYITYYFLQTQSARQLFLHYQSCTSKLQTFEARCSPTVLPVLLNPNLQFTSRAKRETTTV